MEVLRRAQQNSKHQPKVGRKSISAKSKAKSRHPSKDLSKSKTPSVTYKYRDIREFCTELESQSDHLELRGKVNGKVNRYVESCQD